MADKIAIKYPILVAYGGFILVSTLMVGILPPLVNRPECDVSDKNTKALETKNEAVVDRTQRDIQDSIKQTNFDQRLGDILKEYPDYLEELSDRYSRPIKSTYTYCDEISNPTEDYYPWYSYRLPDRYVPTKYDVELFIPDWGLKVYDGFMNITVNITSSSQDKYIILHADREIPILLSVRDKDGNDLKVDCVGQFNKFKNEYFIIKMQDFINMNQGPIKIQFLFIALLPKYDSGIFEFQFGKPGSESTMLASKFEPIEARKGFPCFDEPRFKAIWEFKIDHPTSTIALFNTPAMNDVPLPGLNSSIQTIFNPTNPMPSYMIGMVVFNENDFVRETLSLKDGIKLNLWVRSEFQDEGLAVLNMTEKIFEQLLDIFSGVDKSSNPSEINMFIIPEYPYEAIPHYGLPIFREKEILFKYSSASERDLQRIALMIAKNLAEFWFGNFVTFAWWDELWLQEGFADYVKYIAVNQAYPDWNIQEQFITEELIYVLVNDGYPSSHPIYKQIINPYEIEEYFDDVEKSKTAAILRMVEEEKSWAEMKQALTAYLNAHPWGIAEVRRFYEVLGSVNKWPAEDFFDRWIRQSNYPLLTIRLEKDEDNKQSINVVQSRALNSYFSIFASEQLYPSPYNFTWFIPMQCVIGREFNDSSPLNKEFFIDTKTFSMDLENSGSDFTWVHCDNKFTGYYATDYTKENWENLGFVMKENNPFILPADRANIIHNLFVNGFTERTSYCVVVDVLSYLNRETDYLPWKTVLKHVNDLVGVLDYKEPFYEVARFFGSMMRKIENTMDLWSPSEIHTEELLKETILTLACRLQDSYCLNKTLDLWQAAVPGILSGSFNSSNLPSYVRELVYNYHLQNTYEVDDWNFILRDYENVEDSAERRRLLESLTFTRLPWLLAKLLKDQEDLKLEKTDLFDTVKLMSDNPIGREIAWDFMRINFKTLIDEFGNDDPRIGQMLIDLSRTFENEFMFFELLEFVFFTETGATASARFRALELVSTNIVWLIDKQEEIKDAFSDIRKHTCRQKHEQERSETFIQKAREEYQKRLNENYRPQSRYSKLFNKELY